MNSTTLPDPNPCTLCGGDVYNRKTTHPCCAYWNELEPGVPCPACREAKKARRQRANRWPAAEKGGRG